MNCSGYIPQLVATQPSNWLLHVKYTVQAFILSDKNSLLQPYQGFLLCKSEERYHMLTYNQSMWSPGTSSLFLHHWVSFSQ